VIVFSLQNLIANISCFIYMLLYISPPIHEVNIQKFLSTLYDIQPVLLREAVKT